VVGAEVVVAVAAATKDIAVVHVVLVVAAVNHVAGVAVATADMDTVVAVAVAEAATANIVIGIVTVSTVIVVGPQPRKRNVPPEVWQTHRHQVQRAGNGSMSCTG
jgi:hypothetical protein